MEKHRFRAKSLAYSAIFFALSGAAVLAAPQTTGSRSAAFPPPTSSLAITGYKKWTRANPKPHHVESWLAVLCRSATSQEQSEEAKNPHKDKWVTVYVNKAGQQAMMNRKKPVYPVDSVIVKEKLPHPDSKTPELLTVMRKRERGYNPTSGDWEYLVLNGAGTQVQAQGRASTCQSCHAKWKAQDYVSRTYLTETAYSRLR